MGYFVIIRGPLGIGKSTISKILKEKLKAEYISFDRLLEKYGLDKVDEKEGCIPASNFIEVDEKIILDVREKIKKGKVVIFDGCFYHKEHIDHLLKHLGKGYVFTLKASVEECIRRDSGRKRVYGEGAAREVHSLVARFDFGTCIDVEGKSAEKVASEILERIGGK